MISKKVLESTNYIYQKDLLKEIVHSAQISKKRLKFNVAIVQSKEAVTRGAL